MKKLPLLLILLFVLQISFAQDTSEATDNPEKDFRISVQGGFGYRLASVANNIPPNLKSYVTDLKSGYSGNLDIGYFIKPTWGIGFKYSRFISRNSMTSMNVFDENGNNVYGTVSDDISISFAGPSYISKYVFNNPLHCIVSGISLGYLSYKDEALLVNRTMELTGATFGAVIDVSYDYAVSKYITLGAHASVTQGTLSKIKVDDGYSLWTNELQAENRENLSRMDIGAGIRFKI